MKNDSILKDIDDASFFNNKVFDDIKDAYNFLGDFDLIDGYKTDVILNNIRNENYKKYLELDIYKIEALPELLAEEKEFIFTLYNKFDLVKIISANMEESKKTEKLLDQIYDEIESLERIIKALIHRISTDNEEKQKILENFNLSNYRYKNLINYSSIIEDDIYKELNRQMERQNQIDEIFKTIKEKEERLNMSNISDMNLEINEKIIAYEDKMRYLEDLLSGNKEYVDEYNELKSNYNDIIAYNDKNYFSVKNAYDNLKDDGNIDNHIKELEKKLIDLIERKREEEKFIYEKIGYKNLKNSLDYVTSTYMNKLTEEDKNKINKTYDTLNDKSKFEAIKLEYETIIKNIWKNTITDINEFNSEEDYYFICSNNQFKDEKYQTVLLTKKMLHRMEDYKDYQIGFICNYNNNILYITENDDIMSVSGDDMSNLKTPVQIEQEFLNFGVLNKIALNGYITKIEAVYIIHDKDIDKYIKASNLAKENNLPLIVIKK